MRLGKKRLSETTGQIDDGWKEEGDGKAYAVLTGRRALSLALFGLTSEVVTGGRIASTWHHVCGGGEGGNVHRGLESKSGTPGEHSFDTHVRRRKTKETATTTLAEEAGDDKVTTSTACHRRG